MLTSTKRVKHALFVMLYSSAYVQHNLFTSFMPFFVFSGAARIFTGEKAKGFRGRGKEETLRQTSEGGH